MIASVMITKILRRLNLTSSNDFFTSANLLDYINGGHRDFARRTLCYKKFVLIDSVADVATYDFPSDCLKSIWLGFDDEELKPVSVASLDAIDDDWIGRSGEPRYFVAELGGYRQFRIYLTPSTGSASASSSFLYGVTWENGKLYQWDSDSLWVSKAGDGVVNYLYAAVVYDEKIYAAGEDGALYEWNGTDELVSVADQLSSQRINSLVVFKNEIYGGTRGGKLFKWNGTDAWTEVSDKYSTDDGNIFLCVYNNKLYGGSAALYEWDETSAWTRSATCSDTCGGLVVHDGKLYYLTNIYPVYEWDGADTLTSIGEITNTEAIKGGISFNGKLYVTSADDGALYEWDNISTFTKVASALGDETYIYGPIEYDGKIYAGTYPNGKLYYWNGSDAWVSVAAQLGDETCINELIYYDVVTYTAQTSFTSWDDNNFLLFYAYAPADLASTGEPDLERPFQWALIYYALHQAFSKEGDFQNLRQAEFYMQKYLALVEKKNEQLKVPMITTMGGSRHLSERFKDGPYLPLDHYEADQ